MRTALVMLTVFLVALPARAQNDRPPEELIVTYTTVQASLSKGLETKLGIDVPGRLPLNGWDIEILAHNLKRWLALEAQVGVLRGDILDGKLQDVFLSGGLHLRSLKSKSLTPFLHSSFGISILDVALPRRGLTDTGLAIRIGGGLDIRINDRFAGRVFEMDYLLARNFKVSTVIKEPRIDNNQNSFVFKAGLVIKLR